jgi:hypothetical protein
MVKKVLAMPSKKDDESLLVMVCGPPGFMKLLSGEKTKDMKQVFVLFDHKNFLQNLISVYYDEKTLSNSFNRFFF